MDKIPQCLIKANQFWHVNSIYIIISGTNEKELVYQNFL